MLSSSSRSILGSDSPDSSESAPRYTGLSASSERASRAAQGSSRKKDTRCELELRQALWKQGLRYRLAVKGLPGKPDIVLAREKVAVFCDGDFWHGRDLASRLRKLGSGHNAVYWMAKIQRNFDRDRQWDKALRAAGWAVLRFWETDILKDPADAASRVKRKVDARRGKRFS